MSQQSQQIKNNFINHPYTQQANKFATGQVNALDAEVSLTSTSFPLSLSPSLFNPTATIQSIRYLTWQYGQKSDISIPNIQSEIAITLSTLPSCYRKKKGFS